MPNWLAAICCSASVLALTASAQGPAFPPVTLRPQQGDQFKIVDGDTIWIGIHQIRFLGIEAVEAGQTCARKTDNKTVDCHEDSMNFLGILLKDREQFRCEVLRGKDGNPEMSYGRYVATCYSGQLEVNKAMVEAGWAIASNKPEGDRYRAAEKLASQKVVGLHLLKFDKPWDWRKKKNAGKCDCEAQ